MSSSIQKKTNFQEDTEVEKKFESQVSSKYEDFGVSPLQKQKEFIDFIVNECFAHYNENDIEYNFFFSNHGTHFIGSAAALHDRFNLWSSKEGKECLKTFVRHYEERLDHKGNIKEEYLRQLKAGNEDVLWNNLSGISSSKVRVKDEYATVLKYVNGLEGNKNLLDWQMKKNTNFILQEYFPKVSSKVCGSAFHGLIELGWRLESGFSIAPAISYLIVRGLELGTPTPIEKMDKEKNGDIKNIITRLSADDRIPKIFENKAGFQTRMHAMAQHKDILDEYDIYIDPNADLNDLQNLCEDLNELFFTLFTKSNKKGDFFILHTITSLHALRYVLSHLYDQKERIRAVRNYWRGIIAAYCNLERPQIQDELNDSEQSWDKSIERAEKCEHIDIHWYKLFHVALFTEERNSKLSPMLREAVDIYFTTSPEYSDSDEEK